MESGYQKFQKTPQTVSDIQIRTMSKYMKFPKSLKLMLFSVMLMPLSSFSQDNLKTCGKQLGEFLTQIGERESQIGRIGIEDIKDSANVLYFYASDNCSYISFNENNVDEIYERLRILVPEEYKNRKLAVIADEHEISEYIPAAMRSKKTKTAKFTRPGQMPLVTNVSSPVSPDRGLKDRHIVIWPSHGRYYEQKLARWEWQRARMFMTVEDLYTRSYVMPFLVPMLEKAGANVLIPRERDTQTEEIIVDNDNGIDKGSVYSETNGAQAWTVGNGKGFAHLRPVYKDFENPFMEGTYRESCTTNRNDTSFVEWKPQFRKAGEYAVYVSYRSLENSTEDAAYTVFHRGIATQFKINQTMGGGTWIYLGTFDFASGCNDSNKVVLSNRSGKKGRTVTADAVRFGGGYGNIARHNAPEDTLHKDYSYVTSTYPRFTEGARYYMQWAGVPDSVYSPTNGKDDYRDDYVNRGIWVNYLAGGSSVFPEGKGLNIPVDLSFAFHSDAGTFKSNRIVGTLGIYSTKEYNGKFSNGSSRFLSHDLCELIQSNIVNDIRKQYLPEWTRRGKWNKPYFEAWGPRVPAMLLELLSHQNFADMRYGLDPRFRFTVSRAIYKGMLQFVSSQYGTPYVVQPLPVSHFAIQFTAPGSCEVELSWKAAADSLEPTANPDKYIVYKKIGDGGFDNGTEVDATSWRTTLPPDTVCSFKVTAVNRGGESFPSEVLSAARSKNSVTQMSATVNTKKNKKGKKGKAAERLDFKNDNVLLIVNGFTRISAPDDFVAPAPADTALAGFLNEQDHGVPYIQDFSYIGDMKNFNRSEPWHDDDSGGFGDSYGDYETQVIAGNTFNYPSIHGKSALNAGYSFTSCSSSAVEDSIVSLNSYSAVDLILGKQKQCKMGNGGYCPVMFKTFPEKLQQAITAYTMQGGNIFISGSYVATDLWCNPVSPSPESDRDFARNVLHYTWRNNRAARTGLVKTVDSPAKEFAGDYRYNNTLNAESYIVESPDGIEPADKQGYTIMRYTENNLSAAVAWSGKYSAVTLGFPFESIKSETSRDKLMSQVLKFFNLAKQANH